MNLQEESYITVPLTVNGKNLEARVAPNTRLLDYLRNTLGLKSVKEGCGVGDCGACTVLVDNRPTHACLTMVAEIPGVSITTLEGLETDGKLSDLQDSFLENGAIQCGFCTSGMILTAAGILFENPNATIDDIRHGLSGNLCRCTGYQNILVAVNEVAEKRRADKEHF